MRHAVVVAALAFLAAPGLSSAQFISPRVTNPGNGHEYRLVAQSSWMQAQIAAVRAGGNLVTVNDAAEQNFVFSTFGSYGGQARLLWTGLSDGTTEGQYRWASGQTPAYTNWAPGEPNNAGNEDYVAMFYPGHHAGGRWNDWGTRAVDPIGVPFNGVVEFDPAARPGPVIIETDPTWRVIAPVGNRQGQPLDAVGQTWETQNPGWNTDPNFDTSAWENARQVGTSVWGQDADTPLYARKTFSSTGAGRAVTMLGFVDDDARVYVNGKQVAFNLNGTGPDDLGPVDVTRYIVPGENLVAVKAQDSGAGGEALHLMLYGSVAPGIDGDANLDGRVNSSDFALLAGNFGRSTDVDWGRGDFNGDGRVDSSDFALLAGNFGRSAPAAADLHAEGLLGSAPAIVPEPSSLWVLAMAAWLLRRARAGVGSRPVDAARRSLGGS